MVEIGWFRANARRQLGRGFKRRGPARAVVRRPSPPTFGYDTVKVLQQVWVVTGQPCGKYLAAVMEPTLANMETHARTGAFGRTRARYSPEVRAQLLAMSADTIERLLAPFKLSMYPDGKSTARSRRNQYTEVIPIMSRIPTIDWQPGMVAIGMLAPCGNNAKGQYAFTLSVTAPFTGWTINRAIKNKAAKWVVAAMDEIQDVFPYPIDHVHSDNGSEFLDAAVTIWCNTHNIRMTRSRPHHSNDTPLVEQKNGAIVRRSAFNYRYDTDIELGLLNELWPLVNLRKNLLLPTKKVTGYQLSRKGKSVRSYDGPRTPAQRIKDTGIMLEPQRHHMEDLYASLVLADLTNRLNEIQQRLIRLAAAKTYSQAPHAA